MSVSRKRAAASPEVSLFPFLAVLLCTMGMLIMLLVLIGQTPTGDEQAQALAASNESTSSEPEPDEPLDDLFAVSPSEALKASQNQEAESAQTVVESPVETPSEALIEAPSATTSTPVPEQPREQKKSAREIQYEALREKFGDAELDAIENELKTADWFQRELEGVRERTAESLRLEREKLAATEAQIAELVNRLVELNAQVLSIQKGENAGAPNLETLNAEIEQKAAEIAQLTADVEQMKAKAAANADKKSYAIVPYKGKSGTFRRPIYIECYAQGITLMPENIPFTTEDFLLAKYPGNPFDAALRAARQYYIDAGEATAEDEPYPLLIVRPGGASQYYAAREALASWGGDCGYEFVESDALIDYPAADPVLTRRVEEQIAIARSRLAIPLATLMAEMRQNGTLSGDGSVSDNGGLGNNGGLGGGGLGDGGSNGAGGLVATSGGAGTLADQLGPYAKLENPASLSAGIGTGGPNQTGGTTGANGTNGAGSALDSETLPNYRGVYAPKGGGQNGATASGGGQNPPAPSSAIAGNYQAAEPTAGYAALANQAEQNASNAPSGASAPNEAIQPPNGAISPSLFSAQADRASDSSGQPGIDPRQTLGNTAFESSAQSSVAGTPDGTASKPPKEEKLPSKPEKPPVAASKNDPKAINLNDELRKPTNVAMERPIRVECRQDRIVFPAQAGIPGGSEVVLNDKADAEILRTIVFCVQSWSVAGRNRYWSPWIQAKVADGAQGTYERLEQLLRSQQVRIDRVE